MEISMRREHTPSQSRSSAIALTTALLVLLAACGSTDSSSDSGADPAKGASLPAEAATRVEEALKPVSTFPGPEQAIAPAPGKKVTVITCSPAEQCVRVATGAQAAGEILGWDVTVVDGKGQPTEWNAAMSSALAGGADAIMLSAVPPALVGAGLEAAKKANVPVIYALGQDPQGADALVTPDRAEHGRLVADYIAGETGGSGKVLLLRDKEFPDLEAMGDSFKDELGSVCPGCSIQAEEAFTLGGMAQEVPTIVQTAMQSHPDIDYVFAPYDAVTTFVTQGIRAASHDLVPIIATGGDASTIKAIASGDQTASVGVPAEWIGFQSIDAIARIFDGQPVPETPVVTGLVVKDNLSALAPDGTYDGGFDYEAAYTKLWGK
jgi:ribose transport system substrate-binding protein